MRAVYVLVLANLIAYAMGVQEPNNPFLYGFSHAGTLHLAFNMIALLTFGLGVERERGALVLLIVYAGGLVSGWVMSRGEMPVMGASAGIYALMVVYAWVKRDARVMLLFFPMKAMTLVWVVLMGEVAMLWFGWLPGISHWAHLGGMAFALGWVLWEWNDDRSS